MDDLATWLRAQLDDDERLARAAMRVNPFGLTLCLHLPPEVQQHNDRHDPARVLRQVEVGRQRIDLAVGLLEDVGNPYSEAVGRRLLMLEALPYADRPGYREEWRP